MALYLSYDYCECRQSEILQRDALSNNSSLSSDFGLSNIAQPFAGDTWGKGCARSVRRYSLCRRTHQHQTDARRSMSSRDNSRRTHSPDTRTLVATVSLSHSSVPALTLDHLEICFWRTYRAKKESAFAVANVTNHIVLWVQTAAAILAAIVMRVPFKT